MSHERTVTIKTRAHSILSDVIRAVVEGAGLALVKGPVGIGKTFALDLICDALTEDGVRVIRVTSTPAIEGSIAAFLERSPGGGDGATFTFDPGQGRYPLADAVRLRLRVLPEANALDRR